MHELAESGVEMICRPWVATEDYWSTYWGLTRRVKQRFDAEGIKIPLPQSEVTVRAPTGPAGPADAAGRGEASTS